MALLNQNNGNYLVITSVNINNDFMRIGYEIYVNEQSYLDGIDPNGFVKTVTGQKIVNDFIFHQDNAKTALENLFTGAYLTAKTYYPAWVDA